jgi:hypothetical protein
MWVKRVDCGRMYLSTYDTLEFSTSRPDESAREILELPDSLVLEVSSSGNGYGNFAAGSRSLTGIGNTSALGYVHTVNERVGAAGKFTVNGRVRWSSFASSG